MHGIFINPFFEDYEDNYIDEADDFRIANHTAFGPKKTEIKYAGSGIGAIAGPTPLIDISNRYIQSDVGLTDSIEVTLNIGGKLLLSPTEHAAETGSLEKLLHRASGLEQLLVDNPFGKVEIICENTVVYSLDMARPVELNMNRNNDNWLHSIDYTLSFVGYKSGNTYSEKVRNTVDSWNIEPVSESIFYESITGTVTSKLSTTANITEYSIPQFRVTHRVSAQGAPKVSPTSVYATGASVYWESLKEAQQWVSKRLDTYDETTSTSGISFDNRLSNRKYNFVRSVNYDLTTSLYEVVDTWISMPSGFAYTEDYTIEVSTDDKFVKTVRVNGSIQGMGGWNTSLLNSNTGLIIDGQLDMDNLGGYSGSVTGNTFWQGTGVAASTALSLPDNTKYGNAYRAWHGNSGYSGGIKNLLYWRAASVMNVSQPSLYTQSFVPSSFNRTSTTNNPINSKEALLNVIPISTTETHDKKKGIISYGYEFNNKLSAISGAITENVVINDTGPTDVVAEVFVLGRRLGPVLQSLGATTSSKRDVSIEISVMPPTGFNGYFMTQNACPLFTGGSLYNLIESMVSGLAPFGPRASNVFIGGSRALRQDGQVYTQRNDYSWQPAEGRYTRNVSWIYQQCSNTRPWNDI